MMNVHTPAFTARLTLSAVLCFILAAFTFSLFKNIQYPLLWNDESETAMYAKRILQYGYPKVHDGKNVVWLNELFDKELGIDKKRDIYTAVVWGQYYFAAIGEFFAEHVEDMYLKTALLRIPFALTGLMGLFIMALSIIGMFGEDIIKKLASLIIFFSFALSSVPLALHLREARHPALVVFLAASIFYIYFNYRFYNKLKTAPYFIGLAFFLFLLYHVFPVVYFIFFAAIGLYEVIILLKEKKIGRFLVNLAPIFGTFMLVMPFFIFCQTFALGKAYRLIYFTRIPPWTVQVSSIFSFFIEYEFLYLILAVKMTFFCVRVYFFKRRLGPGFAIKQKMRVSNFLSLFFIVYVLIAALFPSIIIFQRYYIVLIPVAAMILVLDLFGTFELLSQATYVPARRRAKALCAAVFSLILLLSVSDKVVHIRRHAYEILHQYKGPLDFAIPFLRSHYKDTKNLVIATNYEELVYMYYLGSRVIIGFAGNNVDEEAKMHPDVVIFRKEQNLSYQDVFRRYLLEFNYERISFPVLDYGVNNMPELKYHLYLTPLFSDEKDCLDIFIKSTKETA